MYTGPVDKQFTSPKPSSDERHDGGLRKQLQLVGVPENDWSTDPEDDASRASSEEFIDHDSSSDDQAAAAPPLGPGALGGGSLSCARPIEGMANAINRATIAMPGIGKPLARGIGLGLALGIVAGGVASISFPVTDHMGTGGNFPNATAPEDNSSAMVIGLSYGIALPVCTSIGGFIDLTGQRMRWW